MKKHTEIYKHLLLFILFILSFIVGVDVLIRFDGDLFSHSAVPLILSIFFVLLLLSMGYTLGAIIKNSNRVTKFIILWPALQVIVFTLFFILGQVAFFFAWLLIFPIVLMPINLVGAGISLGFQFNRLFLCKGNERIKLIFLSVINLLIIVFVLISISEKYLANIIM